MGDQHYYSHRTLQAYYFPLWPALTAIRQPGCCIGMAWLDAAFQSSACLATRCSSLPAAQLACRPKLLAITRANCKSHAHPMQQSECCKGVPLNTCSCYSCIILKTKMRQTLQGLTDAFKARGLPSHACNGVEVLPSDGVSVYRCVGDVMRVALIPPSAN